MEATVAIASVKVSVVIPALNEAENLPHPKVTLADAVPLLDHPEFRGRRLGSRDIPRIERLMRRAGGRRSYLVLTRHQNDFARLNGLIPAGTMAGLVRAVSASPDFRPVYRRAGAWIFALREPRP